MKMTKRIIAVLFSLLILISAFIVPAFAESFDGDGEVSLKITFKNGEAPVKDAVFNIYHVADYNGAPELYPTEEFKSFSLNLGEMNESSTVKLSRDLENHVISHGIVPFDSGKTNDDGILLFPTNEKMLPHGLYLVMAPRHIEGDTAYDTAPFAVLLPSLDSENNTFIYDLEVSPKFDAEKIPETVTRKVLKVWDDEGKEEGRPNEITVNLLKDGKVFESVKLNKENNWSYKWENLDGKAEWKLTEVPVEGYKASITREGITFVVTNTAVSEDTTDGDISSDSGDTPPSEDSGLPQTGLLWWPVILLLTAGLFLIAVGLIRRRSSNDR